MGVQNDGQVNGIFYAGNEVVCALRSHDAGHVLYADRAYAHLLELLDHLNKLCRRVHGAGGVGDRAGGHCALLYGLFNSDLEVVGIVERVENADDVDAVFDRCTHEAADDIVGIMLVAEDVLASQKHLELGVGHFCADLAQTLPRILVEKAQADVEGCTAPAFNGVESGLIHLFEDGLELVIGKPCRNK